LLRPSLRVTVVDICAGKWNLGRCWAIARYSELRFRTPSAEAAMSDSDDASMPGFPEEEEEVEMEDFQPMDFPVGEEKDVTPDGGVKKKVLVEGEGLERPRKRDKVLVHYVGTLADNGDKFDSSRDRDDPFSFTLGQGQVIKGWDRGVATMRKGEKAMLTCRADYAYGDAGSPPKIPGGATLCFEVELLSWVDSRDISEEKDGSLVKSIVRKGAGYERPRPADEVVARVEVRVAGSDDVVFSDDKATFTVSEGLLCPAVGATVATMLVGEVARVAAKARQCFGETGGLDGRVPPNADLDITVELIEMRAVDDMGYKDGSLKKMTLAKGTGYEKPDEMAKVKVRYTLRLADGTVVDEAHAGEGNELEFVTDEDEVCPALDAAVRRMKAGERAVVTSAPQHAFGDAGKEFANGARVPPNAWVSFEVELVEMRRDRDTWEMSGEEKVEYAEQKKASGNQWFKAGAFDRAMRRYKKAVSAVEYDSGLPEEAKRKVRPLPCIDVEVAAGIACSV